VSIKQVTANGTTSTHNSSINEDWENTTLYAPGGVKVSHQNNVISYNTDKRETSWGHINNIVVDPLFKKENTFNKNSQQDAVKDAAPLL
jgi:hypothetical protein